MMSEEQDGKPGSKRRSGPTAREKANIAPDPQNEAIFLFLVNLFESGFPQKLSLHVVYGAGGRRVGAAVWEHQVKPSEKPDHEALAALTNEILREAQTDCDGIHPPKPTSYGLFPHDSLRSDRPYARKVFPRYPTGTSQLQAESRGDVIYGGDDDEGGGNTRLLMQIIGEERKNNRWMMETLANIVSGAMERDAARIEQLEEQVDGNFDRSVKYIAATEQMLNQSEERKARAEYAAMKNEMLREGVNMIKGTLLPAVAAYMSKGKVGIVEGLKTFMEGLAPEAERALFGVWDNGECKVAGILDADQITHVVGIIERRIDPKTVSTFVESIRPDQMVKANELVERGVLKLSQIQSLWALAKAASDISAKESET